jgi:hypothetical protein
MMEWCEQSCITKEASVQGQLKHVTRSIPTETPSDSQGIVGSSEPALQLLH